jgi:hypothetical protein
MYTKTLSVIKRQKYCCKLNSSRLGKYKLSTAGAPLSTEFSANGIFKLIETEMGTGKFWNAEFQENVVVKKTQHT